MVISHRSWYAIRRPWIREEEGEGKAGGEQACTTHGRNSLHGGIYLGRGGVGSSEFTLMPLLARICGEKRK